MRFVFLLATLVAGSVQAQNTVAFDWFEYAGHDSSYEAPLPKGSFHNPILAGYYPDPSVTRVGDKYYMVNSTFVHWPGIPIHESADLVHWKLIGHALNDPTKVSFDGLQISAGVFAPSIHFHDGTFYIVNTLIGAGGNFIVSASNPAGPWSDPVFLADVEGIDPSLFFDEDGKAYLVHNGPPEGKPLYEGHTAIWIHEFDLANRKAGPRRLLVNGGVDISKKPVWIEGPHLYRVKDWYYLMCAEGGTERGHSEVIFRSRSPWGPFDPYAGNPILTQRDLPENRLDPVTNAGHADLIEMRDGSWWSVFLASRPYEGFRYNTGRETFLLPVTWEDGWPVILPHGEAVPTTLRAPRAMRSNGVAPFDALSGNFRQAEEFFGSYGPEWIQIHVPKQKWIDLEARRGSLTIHPLKVNLDEKRNPSFLARRQEHQNFDASTEFTPPAVPGIAAGLAAYQSENYWYFFGTRRAPDGLQVFLERRAAARFTITGGPTLPSPATLKLRISATGSRYSFYFDAGQGWQPVRENDDGSILSTEVAGGFVGAVLGPYARQE